MKLAEALLLRAEYRDKLDNLHQRILANLKVQEGDAPHEDPKALLEESMELHRTMCALVQRIDRANGTICLPGGETLSQALARRDMLRRERGLLADIAETASERDYRLTHSELRMQTTLDLGALQKEMDRLSRDYRELDTQIQGVNWTTELSD